MNKQLDLYLRLERIMIELDDRGDPFADRMRDLMDPLWYALSDEDHHFLDGREEIDIRVLYPITLNVPDLFLKPVEEQSAAVDIMPENGVGKRFAFKETISWAA
jgi:hypothetical protein